MPVRLILLLPLLVKGESILFYLIREKASFGSIVTSGEREGRESTTKAKEPSEEEIFSNTADMRHVYLSS